MMAKLNVNGKDAHDIYRYLRVNSELNKSTQKKTLVKEIPWNFAKFLVSADGKTIKYFSPRVNPEKIIKFIKQIIESNK